MRVTDLSCNCSENHRNVCCFHFNLVLGFRVGKAVLVWLVNTGFCLFIDFFFVVVVLFRGKRGLNRTADVDRHAGTLAHMQVHSDTTRFYVQLYPTLFCRHVANRSKHRKSLYLILSLESIMLQLVCTL